MKKTKNAGFSLVELVIVVAILAIMMSLMAISINYIQSTSKKQVANTIVAYIGKAQTYAMSKAGEYGVAIGNSGSGCEVKVVHRENDTSSWVNVEDTYSASARVNVVVETTEGTYDMNDSASGVLIMTFDRSSGSFKNLYVNSTATSAQVTAIKCGSKTINVVWRTGKYSVS